MVGSFTDVAMNDDALDEMATNGTTDCNEMDAAMEDLEIVEASMNCEREK